MWVQSRSETANFLHNTIVKLSNTIQRCVHMQDKIFYIRCFCNQMFISVNLWNVKGICHLFSCTHHMMAVYRAWIMILRNLGPILHWSLKSVLSFSSLLCWLFMNSCLSIAASFCFLCFLKSRLTRRICVSSLCHGSFLTLRVIGIFLSAEI